MNMKDIERASFEAWQHVQSAQFWLLMGYKHGDADGPQGALIHLRQAVSILEAVETKS